MGNNKNSEKLYNELQKDTLTPPRAGGAILSPVSLSIVGGHPEVSITPLRPFPTPIDKLPIHYHDAFEVTAFLRAANSRQIIGGTDFSECSAQIHMLPPGQRHVLWCGAGDIHSYRLNFTWEFLKNTVDSTALKAFFSWAYLRPWMHGGDVSKLVLHIPRERCAAFEDSLDRLNGIYSKYRVVHLDRTSTLVSGYMAEISQLFPHFADEFARCFNQSLTDSESAVFEKYCEPMLRTMEYIHDNLTCPITVRALCDCSGFKHTWFSNIFHDIFKMPVMEYVNFMRIRKARELLVNTEKSIQEIGVECGFNSSVYFDRVFKNHTGCTPRTFRNEYVIEYQS